NQELIEIEPDKSPIGHFVNEDYGLFTNKTEKIIENDMIYLFSDGYSDQFGGHNQQERKNGGIKFKYKNFKNLLVECSSLDVSDQSKKLSKTLADWQGNLEQLDDICVIGVRI
ncbi:MAG: hypothetical protein C0594_02455, partial [Marinilabiliales bacterium]